MPRGRTALPHRKILHLVRFRVRMNGWMTRIETVAVNRVMRSHPDADISDKYIEEVVSRALRLYLSNDHTAFAKLGNLIDGEIVTMHHPRRGGT